MSHLSQRRDLEDAAMIEGFARDARTVERLEMLYLLTYADMASVSAENWTEWKAGLLRLLYAKTRETIKAAGIDRPAQGDSLEHRRAANVIDILAAEVHTLGDFALDAFVVRETGGGVPSTPRWESAHADLLRLLSGDEDPHRLVQRRLRRASWAASAVPQVATKLRLDDVSSAESTILDVFTQDRPGLLHAIAEALHGAGVSIVVARIATEGNRATDAFYLREAGGQAGRLRSEERKREVENAVRMAIDELAGRS